LEKVHSTNRTSRYKKRPADNNIPAIVLSEENEVQLKREMEDLQSTIETLNAKLSTLTKAQNSGVYKKDKAIKDLKAKWPSSKTEALYKQIRQLKADRFQEFQEVDHVRKSLKSARSQLYWKKQVS
jgi:predicted  nucleic acid-binding Zn-ribbon protein